MKYLYLFPLFLLFFHFSHSILSQKNKPFELKLGKLSPSAIFREESYYVWYGSMIKENDTLYHLFYSRWPESLGFNAWVTHSEIAHATSRHPLGPYQFSDVVLPARGASFWDGLCTHNPTIHFFNDTYYLYYMGNTGDGIPTQELNFVHRNNQRIGVATSKSPNGPWQRSAVPLIDVSPNQHDALCVNNPSVVRLKNGKYLMIYKAVGDRRSLPFGGPVVHLAALADSPEGPFIKQNQPLFTSVDSDFPAEDPYIFRVNKYYYAIVKDMTGSFTGKGTSLALFVSKDGLNWKKNTHHFVSGLSLQLESGEKKTFGKIERPQLYLDESKKPKIIFLAVKDGNITYNVHIPLENE